ncbi:MAG TPA: hypothetical protein VGB45_16410 [Abditibacterium sp.]|jgi:hypothetical protein
MKGHLGRELLLLSAPIVIIGGLFGWNTWQTRFRTPSIALSVQLQKPEPVRDLEMPFTPDETLHFGWKADVKGGPKSNYRFGWNEQIIATSRFAKRTVVWKLNSAPPGWQTSGVGGYFSSGGAQVQFSSAQGLNRYIHSRRLSLNTTNILPLDTQKLEWRGEMVAVPSDEAQIWQSPLPSAELAKWRKIPGSVSWKGVLSLGQNSPTFDPVLLRSQKAHNSKSGVEVEILSKRVNRRSLRRLVTFDGKTRRELWTDKDRFNSYCSGWGSGGYSKRDGEHLYFEIGAIPAAWGEVSLECETVFDIHKRAPTASTDTTKLGEKELLDWEKKFNGWRVSRRHVLRPVAKKKQGF